MNLRTSFVSCHLALQRSSFSELTYRARVAYLPACLGPVAPRSSSTPIRYGARILAPFRTNRTHAHGRGLTRGRPERCVPMHIVPAWPLDGLVQPSNYQRIDRPLSEGVPDVPLSSFPDDSSLLPPDRGSTPSSVPIARFHGIAFGAAEFTLLRPDTCKPRLTADNDVIFTDFTGPFTCSRCAIRSVAARAGATVGLAPTEYHRSRLHVRLRSGGLRTPVRAGLTIPKLVVQRPERWSARSVAIVPPPAAATFALLRTVLRHERTEQWHKLDITVLGRWKRTFLRGTNESRCSKPFVHKTRCTRKDFAGLPRMNDLEDDEEGPNS